MFHLRFKRTGMLTKIIVLGLIVVLATSLLDQFGDNQEKTILRDQLLADIDTLNLDNQRTSDSIMNSDDPAVMEQAARDEGFVKKGETLYVDIAG